MDASSPHESPAEPKAPRDGAASPWCHALKLPDGQSLSLDRPRIMGILNVTPDSFSDGGQWTDFDQAVDHALAMVADGAEVIDIGGESTRPGSQRIDAAEQKRRVLPVIKRLIEAFERVGTSADSPNISGPIISIDTTLADVAEAALDAGASMLNDVAAGREDERMLSLAAERGAPICLMHMQGQPANMQKDPHYDNVVEDVLAFLLKRAEAAAAAGVPAGQVVLDPGIGFGKTREHNLELLRRLDRFVATGYPVLLGTSRKRFMGSLCAKPDGSQPSPEERVGATCGTTAWGVAQGVPIFRVHDVLPNRQAADVAWVMGEVSDQTIKPSSDQAIRGENVDFP